MTVHIFLEARIQTNRPERQKFSAVVVRLGNRAAPVGSEAVIELELFPGGEGSAALRQAEAREIARYLNAMADSLDTQERP